MVCIPKKPNVFAYPERFISVDFRRKRVKKTLPCRGGPGFPDGERHFGHSDTDNFSTLSRGLEINDPGGI